MNIAYSLIAIVLLIGLIVFGFLAYLTLKEE